MPQSEGQARNRVGAKSQQPSRQRMPSTDRSQATTGPATGMRELQHPRESLLGSDLSQTTFERHASLLGGRRMSQPAYARQRAVIAQQLQREYGNHYVQRLVEHISRKRAEAVQCKPAVGTVSDKYEPEGVGAVHRKPEDALLSLHEIRGIHTRPFSVGLSSSYLGRDTVQRIDGLTQAGEDYAAYIKTEGTWGGYPEANSVASYYGFQTHIFELVGDQGAQTLHLLTDVGGGDNRTLSLLWNGVHYQVLDGGAGLDGQVYNNQLLKYDPVGDGNCMFEAIFYVLRMGQGNVEKLLGQSQYRAAYISNMRTIAAQHMDPALLNILGDERNAELERDEDFEKSFDFSSEQEQVVVSAYVSLMYKDYPPKTHYIKRKKKDLYISLRSDKSSRGTKLKAALQGFKDDSLDRSKINDVIAYMENHEPYQLAPAPKGNKAESLLKDALGESSVVSIKIKDVEAHLDNGQLKHQPIKYKIGTRITKAGNTFKPDKYGSPAWHRTTTLAYMAGWADRLGPMSEGEKIYHGQAKAVNGIHYEGYCLLVNGNKYVFFHCYPADGSKMKL